jgi:hypothetical protein
MRALKEANSEPDTSRYDGGDCTDTFALPGLASERTNPVFVDLGAGRFRETVSEHTTTRAVIGFKHLYICNAGSVTIFGTDGPNPGLSDDFVMTDRIIFRPAPMRRAGRRVAAPPIAEWPLRIRVSRRRSLESSCVAMKKSPLVAWWRSPVLAR